MKWTYSINLYINTHCSARGLRPKTMKAYQDALRMFAAYSKERLAKKGPEEMKTRDVLEYVEYLRTERRNQHATVNRAVAVIRMFYKGLVALGYIGTARENPMEGFPEIKAAPEKYRDTLTEKEVAALAKTPGTKTELNVRDTTLITLLYCTGIRVSECAELCDGDVNIPERQIKVIGKGGSERTVPLNEEVAKGLECYRKIRGEVKRNEAFFQSREGGKMSCSAIRQRIKKHALTAKIPKKVTPHVLRHTFATHLIRRGENLVVVKELLGHRQLTSTQRYIHMTAQDMREAMERHPIRELAGKIFDKIRTFKLPFQFPPGTKFAFGH